MFKQEARIYDKFYNGKTYDEEVKLIYPYLKGNSVIDFGCGTGKHALLLQSRGMKVYGVEPCREMANKARDKGVHVFEWDKIKNKWDNIILMFDVLNFIHDPERYVEAFHKKLKSGGRLIIETWNPNKPICRLGIKFNNWILRLSYKALRKNLVMALFIYFPPLIFSRHCLRLYKEEDIKSLFRDFKLVKKIEGKSIIWIFEK